MALARLRVPAVTGSRGRLVPQPGKDRGYAYLVLERFHVRDLSGGPTFWRGVDLRVAEPSGYTVNG